MWRERNGGGDGNQHPNPPPHPPPRSSSGAMRDGRGNGRLRDSTGYDGNRQDWGRVERPPFKRHRNEYYDSRGAYFDGGGRPSRFPRSQSSRSWGGDQGPDSLHQSSGRPRMSSALSEFQRQNVSAHHSIQRSASAHSMSSHDDLHGKGMPTLQRQGSMGSMSSVSSHRSSRHMYGDSAGMEPKRGNYAGYRHAGDAVERPNRWSEPRRARPMRRLRSRDRLPSNSELMEKPRSIPPPPPPVSMNLGSVPHARINRDREYAPPSDQRDSFGGDKRDSFGGDKRDSFGGDKRDSFGGDKRDSFGGDKREGFSRTDELGASEPSPLPSYDTSASRGPSREQDMPRREGRMSRSYSHSSFGSRGREPEGRPVHTPGSREWTDRREYRGGRGEYPRDWSEARAPRDHHWDHKSEKRWDRSGQSAYSMPPPPRPPPAQPAYTAEHAPPKPYAPAAGALPLPPPPPPGYAVRGARSGSFAAPRGAGWTAPEPAQDGPAPARAPSPQPVPPPPPGRPPQRKERTSSPAGVEPKQKPEESKPKAEENKSKFEWDDAYAARAKGLIRNSSADSLQTTPRQKEASALKINIGLTDGQNTPHSAPGSGSSAPSSRSKGRLGWGQGLAARNTPRTPKDVAMKDQREESGPWSGKGEKEEKVCAWPTALSEPNSESKSGKAESNDEEEAEESENGLVARKRSKKDKTSKPKKTKKLSRKRKTVSDSDSVDESQETAGAESPDDTDSQQSSKPPKQVLKVKTKQSKAKSSKKPKTASTPDEDRPPTPGTVSDSNGMQVEKNNSPMTPLSDQVKEASFEPRRTYTVSPTPILPPGSRPPTKESIRKALARIEEDINNTKVSLSNTKKEKYKLLSDAAGALGMNLSEVGDDAVIDASEKTLAKLHLKSGTWGNNQQLVERIMRSNRTKSRSASTFMDECVRPDNRDGPQTPEAVYSQVPPTLTPVWKKNQVTHARIRSQVMAKLKEQQRIVSKRSNKLVKEYMGRLKTWRLKMIRREGKSGSKSKASSVKSMGKTRRSTASISEGSDRNEGKGRAAAKPGAKPGAGSSSLGSNHRYPSRGGGSNTGDFVASEWEQEARLKELMEMERRDAERLKNSAKCPDMILTARKRKWTYFDSGTNGILSTDMEEPRCRDIALGEPCVHPDRDSPAVLKERRLPENFHQPSVTGCNCAAAAEESLKHVNPWSDIEKAIFMDKFLQYPKDFRKIASFLGNKSTRDVVSFYYLSKTVCNYKRLLREQHQYRRKSQRRPNWLLTLQGLRAMRINIPAELLRKSNKAFREEQRYAALMDQRAKEGLEGKGDEPPKPMPFEPVLSDYIPDNRFSMLPLRRSKANAMEQLTATEAPPVEVQAEEPGKHEEVATADQEKRLTVVRGKNRQAQKWTDNEKKAFIEALQVHGKDWEKLSKGIQGKNANQMKNFYQNYKHKLGLQKIVDERVTVAQHSESSTLDAAVIAAMNAVEKGGKVSTAVAKVEDPVSFVESTKGSNESSSVQQPPGNPQQSEQQSTLPVEPASKPVQQLQQQQQQSAASILGTAAPSTDSLGSIGPGLVIGGITNPQVLAAQLYTYRNLEAHTRSLLQKHENQLNESLQNVHTPEDREKLQQAYLNSFTPLMQKQREIQMQVASVQQQLNAANQRQMIQEQLMNQHLMHKHLQQFAQSQQASAPQLGLGSSFNPSVLQQPLHNQLGATNTMAQQMALLSNTSLIHAAANSTSGISSQVSSSTPAVAISQPSNAPTSSLLALQSLVNAAPLTPSLISASQANSTTSVSTTKANSAGSSANPTESSTSVSNPQ